MWHHYRDGPNNIIANSESFKSKIKKTGKTPAAGNANNVLLKYLSDFWRTLERFLINCELNLILTWSKNCVISSATGKIKLAITDAILYVPVVTLSNQDNAKLLQQLKSVF